MNKNSVSQISQVVKVIPVILTESRNRARLKMCEISHTLLVRNAVKFGILEKDSFIIYVLVFQPTFDFQRYHLY